MALSGIKTVSYSCIKLRLTWQLHNSAPSKCYFIILCATLFYKFDDMLMKDLVWGN